MTTFSELGLMPELLATLATEGYVEPTPIQAQAIPPLLAGRDLLGIAQTGTGKTAAFALPILQRLSQDKRPTPRNGARVLVLSPTRELASQIAESFKTYGRNLGFSVTVVFGGVAHRPQSQALARGVDVLVATPGRLLDHMSEGIFKLGTTEVLVLDEADQMLDLGFIQPLRRIFKQLPAGRQNLFFSATMPHEIGALAAELLRNPERVEVTPVAKTADRVEQKVVFVESNKKRSLLVELMANPEMARTLVFTRTKRGADRVASHLEGAGITVAAIHGNKSQRQREIALENFKKSRIRALVATDIAARGIDIDLVTHVINYELPNVPEAYVHRIGRTARAGAEGIAISLVDGEERAYLRDIERLTRQTIPNEDRRNDPTLVAAIKRDERGRGDRKPEGERGPRSEGRSDRKPREGGGFRGRPRGDRPEGDRPARANGDRPQGARPAGDRSDGGRGNFRDRPRSERPEGDRPRGDRPEGARKFGDRPRGDRPEGARKFGDRPRGDRPEGGRGGFGERPRGDRPQRDGAEGSLRAHGRTPHAERPRTGEPRPDRPWRDRPERPEGGRPAGDRPHRGGERRFDGPRPDRAERDPGRPSQDRPERREQGPSAKGWPFSDAPQGGRPDGERKPRRDGAEGREGGGRPPHAGKPHRFGDRPRGDGPRADRGPRRDGAPGGRDDRPRQGPRDGKSGGFEHRARGEHGGPGRPSRPAGGKPFNGPRSERGGDRGGFGGARKPGGAGRGAGGPGKFRAGGPSRRRED